MDSLNTVEQIMKVKLCLKTNLKIANSLISGSMANKIVDY